MLIASSSTAVLVAANAQDRFWHKGDAVRRCSDRGSRAAGHPSAVAGERLVVEFTSYSLLDLRAGKADVLELPVAHRVKLNNRRLLDASDEIALPPLFHGSDQAAAPQPNSISSGRVECRTQERLDGFTH